MNQGPYCLFIKTSKYDPCTEFLGDSEIHININGQRTNIIQSAFKKHEICSPSIEINKLHDIFQLNSRDGFCIESLSINEKEILGANSSQKDCGDVGMLTSEIKIKNEEIIYYECKGK